MSTMHQISRPLTAEAIILNCKWEQTLEEIKAYYIASVQVYNDKLKEAYDKAVEETKGYMKNDLESGRNTGTALIGLLKIRTERLEELHKDYTSLYIYKDTYKR